MKHSWDQRLGVWWIASDRPELPAIAESPSGVTLTFGELAGRAHQLVHALRARGIGAGAIVAYALPNDADVVWWQLAMQEAGIHAVALNPALSADEIGSVLEHAGAAGLVAGHQYANHVAGLSGTALPELRVVVGGELPGFQRYEDLVAGFSQAEPADRRFGTPISYSSGTTGKPKAIARDDRGGDPSVIADEMKLFGRAFQFEPFTGVHLVSAGMHHGGCQSFYQGALNVGQALAIMGRYDAERALAMISRHRVSTAYMVPTQFVRLLRLPQAVRDSYDVSSLRVVVHSAAPCPVEVKQAMMDWWGPVIWETYGGMEGAATIAKPHRWLSKPGTVGRAVRGMTVKILDDDGQPVPPGELGVVYLEPDEPTFRYRNDPGLTASVHHGRAFTLGDVGFLDEDGYLFVRDRVKDMIISGGVNIYPAEAEAVLASHPAVGDVAVIGVPDAEWGESVKAVVELADGYRPGNELGEELIAFCRERLAGYKCPRSVDFAAALPRTDGGKLFKRLLREEYRKAAQADQVSLGSPYPQEILYKFWYTNGMASPAVIQVHPLSDVRARLSGILARFRREGAAAEPVAFGSHRKPEAILLPYEVYERYEALARQRERLDWALSAAQSVQVELPGAFSPEHDHEVSAYVDGEISAAELYRRTVARYRQP